MKISNRLFTCDSCSKRIFKRHGEIIRKIVFLHHLYIDMDNNISIFQCPKCLKTYNFTELTVFMK